MKAGNMPEAEPRLEEEERPFDTTPIQGFVGPKLRALWNLLSARIMTALAPFGLGPGAYPTLALIDANPGCSQNDLARAMNLDKSAVVALIDELEEHGLAVRTRSPKDRRRHALTLTPEGAAMYQSMRGPFAEPGQAIRQALSKEEVEQLMSLLDRAHRALL